MKTIVAAVNRRQASKANRLAFTDATWEDLTTKIAVAFSMPEKAASKLRANKTAKLVGALPYLAGCKEAERTALSHLATFVLAGSESCRRVFDHTPADDKNPIARLRPIADFHAGNHSTIERGMKLLAIVMINGYRHDVHKDELSGEYNPVGAGAWNADAMIASLQADVEATSDPDMDSILPPELAPMSYWWDH